MYIKTTNTSGHIVAYDLLRIIAAFLVIVTHVCFSAWNKLPVTSIGWQTLNAFDCVSHCAVPLFVMISGTVFLRRDAPIEPKTVGKKYALKLLIAFLFWSLFYAVFTAGFHNILTAQWIKTVIVNCLDYKYHLWFLPEMIVAYLFLPLLWPLVHYKDGKYVGYACLLLLVLKYGIATARLLPLPDVAYSWLSDFSAGIVNFIGYMLFGYYISTVRKKKPAPWLTVLVFAASSLLMVVWNSAMSVHAGEAMEKVFSTGRLPVLLQSTALFSLFAGAESCKRLEHIRKPVSWLAPCTFGIYVIHVFVLDALTKWLHLSAHTIGLPIFLSVPLLSLTVFAISLLITVVLKKLPVIKNWLV